MFTRATQQYLSCNVNLNDPIPLTPNVTINLEKNGQPIDLSNSRIHKTLTINNNVYSTILTFTPVDNDDAGNYTCTGTVSSVVSGSIGSGGNFEVEPLIIGSSNFAQTGLIVHGQSIDLLICEFSSFYHCSYTSSSNQCYCYLYCCYRKELFCSVFSRCG